MRLYVPASSLGGRSAEGTSTTNRRTSDIVTVAAAAISVARGDMANRALGQYFSLMSLTTYFFSLSISAILKSDVDGIFFQIIM